MIRANLSWRHPGLVALALVVVAGCELIAGIDDKKDPGTGGGGAAGASTHSTTGTLDATSASTAAGGGGATASSSGAGTCASGSGGGNSTPRSCAAGAPGAGHDCGACEDCCATATVTGGDFLRSYDGQGLTDPSNPAHVSSFLLDRFEVTVGRFRAFVEAYPGSKPQPGDGLHPLIANSGWDSAWDPTLPVDRDGLRATLKCRTGYETWTDEASGDETLPIGCIIWPVAFAFCAWDGGRLPTEAEWNYASSGGTSQREFPWGSSDPDPDAVLAAYGCFFGGHGTCTGIVNVAPVGSIAVGVGVYGQLDLAGNVWEWNLDWHDDVYPPNCSDCANLVEPQPPGSGFRVIRGGGFDSDWLALRAGDRGRATPDYYDETFGVRCARDL